MPCRIAVLLLLAGSLFTAGCDRGDHPRQIDRPAPDFTITDGARTLRLSSYRGKVVLLNFWASWCAPCVEEIPSLNALQRKMPQLVIIGVDVDQNPEAYTRFLARHEVDYLTIRDAQQHSNALYGTHLFPETFAIDQQGEIRRKFIIVDNWTSPEILEFLSHL